jgi:hypothetical protein
MAKADLELLRSMNRDLFAGRWSDADLQQLVAPGFGVISSFEGVLGDLAKILQRDLGDTPPETTHAESAK